MSRPSPLAVLRRSLRPFSRGISSVAVARRGLGTAQRGPFRRGGAIDTLTDEALLRRLERMNLMTRTTAFHGVAGEHRSHRRSGSTEFADFRKYVSGDDFRRIDWNAYGRLESLFLKLTEAKEDVPVHLLVDCSRSMDWGQHNKLGQAKDLAAALGYLALARFDAVSVAYFSDRLHDVFPMARGKTQALRLVNFLRQIDVGGPTEFQRVVAQYCARPLGGGLAIVISDLLFEDRYEDGLARLMESGLEVIVLHVVDPAELHPTVGGHLELVDAESEQTVEVTVGPDARAAYERRFAAWCDEVDAFCKRRGIAYLMVDTSVPLEQVIVNDMRVRKILR